MKIYKAHSYLTYPAKALKVKPKILGANVAANTKLYDMLSDVLVKSKTECNIDISFNPTNGQQDNESRKLIIDYVDKPTRSNGLKIAEALQNVTTNRSGMGLLFLVLVKVNKRNRLLISRFPADYGVLAEDTGNKLNVEFVEKVFM